MAPHNALRCAYVCLDIDGPFFFEYIDTLRQRAFPFCGLAFGVVGWMECL
jgi:hypothetical protein